MKKKTLFAIGAMCAFGLGAADGIWTGSDAGQWSDSANWLDGILPDEGGIATIQFNDKSISTIDASGVAATLGEFVLDCSATGDPSSISKYLMGGTFTLVPPAVINLNAYIMFTFGANTLANEGDTLVTGFGRCVFTAPQALAGRTIVSNNYLRITHDTALGPTPATLKSDAVILTGGTLQNGASMVTVAETRGITLTERGGVSDGGI